MNRGFLHQLSASSRARVESARRSISDAEMLGRALATHTPPALRLHPRSFDLIAEMKLRSPAVGQLKSEGEDVEARARQLGESAVLGVARRQRMDYEVA